MKEFSFRAVPPLSATMLHLYMVFGTLFLSTFPLHIGTHPPSQLSLHFTIPKNSVTPHVANKWGHTE